MRRRIKVLSIVFPLLCLPAGAAAMSAADDAASIYHPTITEVEGAVSVKGEKQRAWEEAREGMLLLSGDTLRTGKDSRARISFPSGDLEIYETTVVVIPDIDVQERKKDIKEVYIEEGKTLFNINPLGVERGFEFKTRNIQGGVKGTVFSVSYVEGGTSVNVYRGVVSISGLDRSRGQGVDLKAGKSVRITDRTGMGKVRDFDPSVAIEDYQNNMPPGLDEKGLPADYRANISNKGVRKRGNEKVVSPDNDTEPDKDVDNDDSLGEDEK